MECKEKLNVPKEEGEEKKIELKEEELEAVAGGHYCRDNN